MVAHGPRSMVNLAIGFLKSGEDPFDGGTPEEICNKISLYS